MGAPTKVRGVLDIRAPTDMEIRVAPIALKSQESEGQTMVVGCTSRKRLSHLIRAGSAQEMA